MSKNTTRPRRAFLAAAGTAAVTGLTGCLGGDGDGGTDTDTDTVPPEEATATALDGQTRDPDAVSSKEALSYQSTPSNGTRCSDCRFYVEDRTGDGLGACTLVAGRIDPDGWCASYAEYQG